MVLPYEKPIKLCLPPTDGQKQRKPSLRAMASVNHFSRKIKQTKLLFPHCSAFATPGAINSQSNQNLQEQLGNDCFKAEPMVFSPDFDGRDDFTNIIYGCNATGRVANILIYDALGRQVRTLTRNETLVTSGVIRWDGTNDRGEKVRIGYYLIYLEVFDLSGNVTRQQLKVAVTGRF